MNLLKFQSSKIEEREIDRIKMTNQSMKFVFQESKQREREESLDNFHIPRKIRGKLSKGFPPKFLTPTYIYPDITRYWEESDRGSGIIGSFIEVRTSW